MQSKRLVSVFTILVVLVALVLTSVSFTSAQEPKVVRVALMGQDDIPSLDPSLADDVSGIQALTMSISPKTSTSSSATGSKSALLRMKAPTTSLAGAGCPGTLMAACSGRRGGPPPYSVSRGLASSISMIGMPSRIS